MGSKFNEAAVEAAVNGAALKTTDQKKTKKVMTQIIIRNIPQEWADAVWEQGNGATMTGYVRQALKEKLEREGLI